MNVCFFGVGGVGGYYGTLLTQYLTLISLFEKLRFYFFDVALTPGLIQKVIANVFSSARIKKIFV